MKNSLTKCLTSRFSSVINLFFTPDDIFKDIQIDGTNIWVFVLGHCTLEIPAKLPAKNPLRYKTVKGCRWKTGAFQGYSPRVPGMTQPLAIIYFSRYSSLAKISSLTRWARYQEKTPGQGQIQWSNQKSMPRLPKRLSPTLKIAAVGSKCGAQYRRWASMAISIGV